MAEELWQGEAVFVQNGAETAMNGKLLRHPDEVDWYAATLTDADFSPRMGEATIRMPDGDEVAVRVVMTSFLGTGLPHTIEANVVGVRA